MSKTKSPGLLVSVRSVTEARAALGGGADLIDVKEPARGSLGKADDETIAEIAEFVDGRKAVSAAMGEVVEYLNDPPGTEYSVLSTSLRSLTFLKWGLANCGGADWQALLDLRRAQHSGVVTVAYADWRLANAPCVSDVVNYAIRRNGVLLIDTWCKASGKSLLDWMSVAELQRVCDRCRSTGVRIALAGSLDIEAIRQLRDASPDWFAVRTAACEDGRHGTVSAAKVRELVNLLQSGEPSGVSRRVECPVADVSTR